MRGSRHAAPSIGPIFHGHVGTRQFHFAGEFKRAEHFLHGGQRLQLQRNIGRFGREKGHQISGQAF